jgi:poly-gamma-glutamate capsule biosynthesis protein CapA/YwtB (metallophosphatase superfamily)
MTKLKIVASGDSFITRRISEREDCFNYLAEIIHSADARLTNLEVTVHNNEATPSAQSGGTWAVASPSVLKDIKDYGFNLVSWSNNHTLDYLYDGLEYTKKYLEEYEFIHAGAGMNLAEADEPKYLETPNGRVALIAACSTFHPFNAAGEQRRDMKGRPGINPLRYESIYMIKKEKHKILQEIAKATGVNNVLELGINQGNVKPVPEGYSLFSPHLRFKEVEDEENEGLVTKPSKKDTDRILKRISEAKRQSNYVILSLHAHEMEGANKEDPAEFIRIFSRKCIDEGADVVVGHGPHVLRGIEIYKGKPIFYSLGNFIFQNDTPLHFPQDFFEKYSLGLDASISDALDKRSSNGTKGLGTIKENFETILPYWEVENGKLIKLTLYPVELDFNLPRYSAGVPRITRNTSILERVKDLSMPFNTNIEIKDGIAEVDMT